MRPTLHLIGVNHFRPPFQAFEYNLTRGASQGDFYNGLEDVVRAPAIETAHFKDTRDIPQGNNYGIESEFSSTVAQLLTGHYMHVRGKPEHPDEVRRLTSFKCNLIWHLRYNRTLAEIYNEAVSGKLPANVELVAGTIGGVSAAFRERDDWLEAQTVVGKFVAEHHEPIIDQEGWADVYNRMLTIAFRRIEHENPSRAINLKHLLAYQSNPHHPRAFRRTNSVCLDWRNEDIARNMTGIAKRAHGNGKDLYVAIGSRHIPGLAEIFDSEVAGLQLKVTRDDKGVPEEYHHMCDVPEDVERNIQISFSLAEGRFDDVAAKLQE